MKSKKCMACGLVNAATESVCRRCGSAISDSNSPAYNPRPDSPSNVPGSVSSHGFIAEQIRSANKRLLLTNACLAAVLLLAFAVCGRYFYNFFFGPFPVTEETLTSTKNAGSLSRYFVKVPIDNIVDYSVQEVKKQRRGGREEVVSEYFALILGDKLLLVKASPDHREPEFAGSIEDLSSASAGDVMGRFIQNDPGARGAFLPVMLDATGFRNRGYIGLAIGVPLLLLSIWNLKKALARRANPDQHPIVAALARYGPPQTVASRIDGEVAAAGGKMSGRVLVTPSWLLYTGAYTLNIRSLDELVWAYKKVTKHYTNFIPTGKTYSTIIWDRHGKSLEITNRKEQDSHSILEGIRGRAPWVLIGYADDLAKAWKSDAAGVIGAVDKRRNHDGGAERSSQLA